MAENKTNVMRILDQKKIPYIPHTYPHGEEAVDGETIARLTGEDPAHVFKTLVTRGHSGKYYVFVVPVEAELHLKKAAVAAGEKAVDMIAVKQLLPLTGYVRGGCSPIGMKKPFPTFLAKQAQNLTTILVSAGKIGTQIEATPDDLIRITGGSFADITG
ncbi:MAG: Cys-tRNA(Pro) deacylase [Acutalibacteraceae bacterium]